MDRQMQNLESLPGGRNVLERMYRDVQVKFDSIRQRPVTPELCFPSVFRWDLYRLLCPFCEGISTYYFVLPPVRYDC